MPYVTPNMQVWISPWQVAHVLSIMRTLQADLAPAWRPAAARTRSRRRSRSKLSYLSSSHLHVACTLHVPLISSIIMVRRPSDASASASLVTSYSSASLRCSPQPPQDYMLVPLHLPLYVLSLDARQFLPTKLPVLWMKMLSR